MFVVAIHLTLELLSQNQQIGRSGKHFLFFRAQFCIYEREVLQRSRIIVPLVIQNCCRMCVMNLRLPQKKDFLGNGTKNNTRTMARLGKNFSHLYVAKD